MNVKDLRNLVVDELRKRETETREDLFKLRFKHGIRRLENTAQLNALRKDIARIQTILVEKQNQAA